MKLIDLIKTRIDLGKYKYHLAQQGSSFNPLDVYYDGNFEEWQRRVNKRNYPVDHVIAIIDMGNERWLFAGVWKPKGG